MLIDWKSFLPKVKGAYFLRKPRPRRSERIDKSARPTNSGRLDAKTRELISLAVAVTTRSDGCIAAHTKAAIDLGAAREEVAEAASTRPMLR